MQGLKKLFDNCIENQFIPRLIVLCGNFSSKGVAQGNAREVRRYQGTLQQEINSVYCLLIVFLDGFDSLADLIASYPLITRQTYFVLVPGPRDITVNSILPRKPLLSSLTSKLRSKVPKLHIGTNPCRIKFCEQEVVVFREDLMARMLRNLVGVKPNVREDDLKRYVSVQTLL